MSVKIQNDVRIEIDHNSDLHPAMHGDKVIGYILNDQPGQYKALTLSKEIIQSQDIGVEILSDLSHALSRVVNYYLENPVSDLYSRFTYLPVAIIPEFSVSLTICPGTFTQQARYLADYELHMLTAESILRLLGILYKDRPTHCLLIQINDLPLFHLGQYLDNVPCIKFLKNGQMVNEENEVTEAWVLASSIPDDKVKEILSTLK